MRYRFFIRTSTVAILLSTYAKILIHTQPPDVGLQQQILTIFKK
jgi:AP-2 complex subunit alpha